MDGEKKKFDLSKLSSQSIIEGIIKYTLPIMFIVSMAIMIYLAFIDNISMPGDWRSITLFGAAGAFLSYQIWLTSYRKQYDSVLITDSKDQNYSIHRRYYFARKDWKLVDLQAALERAKEQFRKAWIADVEEICGRKEEEIVKGHYRGYSHKWLIYRLKHKLYPKYGVSHARQLLDVLNVGTSGSQSIPIKAAERYFKSKAYSRLVTTLLILCTTGSIVVDFLTGSIWTALFKLVVAIMSLILALVFGSLNGYTGAKKKLDIAETVAYTLEEWKNAKPSEEPYHKTEEEEANEQPQQMQMEMSFGDQAPVVHEPNSADRIVTSRLFQHDPK